MTLVAALLAVHVADEQLDLAAAAVAVVLLLLGVAGACIRARQLARRSMASPTQHVQLSTEGPRCLQTPGASSALDLLSPGAAVGEPSVHRLLQLTVVPVTAGVVASLNANPDASRGLAREELGGLAASSAAASTTVFSPEPAWASDSGKLSASSVPETPSTAAAARLQSVTANTPATDKKGGATKKSGKDKAEIEWHTLEDGRITDAELEAAGFPPMTPRWVRAEKGRVEPALARYKVTMQWRRDNDIDSILEKPHRFFHVIKHVYPHYYHHTDKEGHVFWYEAPGGVDMKRLKDFGITAEIMHFHFLYVTEFLWKVLASSDDAVCFSVINLDGVTMANARGEAMDYTRHNTKLLGDHYPERSFRTLVVNSPWWVHTLYKLIAAMLDPVTKAKIFVLPHGPKSSSKVLEFVDPHLVPERFFFLCVCLPLY
jgi:hypothetical protein